MFVAVVFLLSLSRQVNGDDTVRYRCGENRTDSVTFTPAVDGVEGRYTVELCTVRNPNVTSWHIDLLHYETPERCRSGRKPDNWHSTLKEEIVVPAACTYVCYSADFDLIFSGCYNIHSEFLINSRSLRPKDTYITVNNNISKQIYEDNKPHVKFIPDKKMVTLHWYLGLPVSYFDVLITPWLNKTKEYSDKRINATDHCSVALPNKNEVKCRLELSEMCYQASFHHNATWTPMFNQQATVDFNFCHATSPAPVVQARGRAAWWALGALLGASAALLVAALVTRALNARTFHKNVLRRWQDALENEPPPAIQSDAHNILVLYAREGEHGQRAIDALKVLLQQVTSGQVLDLYSAAVLARAGPAPHTWLRDVLFDAHTRVVLVQSPAAAALYNTQLQSSSLQLQEPLLGVRAQYRRAHVGDALVAAALRLLAETVAAHNLYNKYYIATYGSLETEVLPTVVPYRRYILPEAAATLARDVSGAGPARDVSGAGPARDVSDAGPGRDVSDAALHTYVQHAQHFVTHAQQNPDYLIDELIIM